MRIWFGALLLLAGCTPPVMTEAANNIVAVTENAAPEPAPPPGNAAAEMPTDAPLGEWLVGHWAYGEDCATDFLVAYQADGKFDAHGDLGTWKIAGTEVTETVTDRRTDDDPATAIVDDATMLHLDPPETIRYTVERLGADRGMLRRGGKTQAIRRC